MREKRVYLAGAMTGVGDRGAGWRRVAAEFLRPLAVEDPVLFETDPATTPPGDIVRMDLGAICRCGAVLAYVGRPSWGTAMELWHAKQVGVPVVGWTDDQPQREPLSAWLRYVVSDGVHTNLLNATKTVRGMLL